MANAKAKGYFLNSSASNAAASTLLAHGSSDVTQQMKWFNRCSLHQSRCGSQSDWFYIMDHERLSLSLGASMERKSGKISTKIQEKMHSLPPLLLVSCPFSSSKATNLPVGSSLQHLLWNLLNASTKQQQNEIPRCQNGARRNGFWWLVVSPCLVHVLGTNYKKCVTHDVDLNWSNRI